MENLDLNSMLTKIKKKKRERPMDTLDWFNNRMEMAENAETLNIGQ